MKILLIVITVMEFDGGASTATNIVNAISASRCSAAVKELSSNKTVNHPNGGYKAGRIITEAYCL